MAITQFIHYRIALAGANGMQPCPQPKPPQGDCDIQIIETVPTPDDSLFTLHGYARQTFLRHALLPVKHEEPAVLGDAVRWSATLPTEVAEELQSLVGHVSVPVGPRPGISGCDGTWYDLSIEQEMSSLHFRWWVRVPAGWEGIGSLAGEVLESARRTLALPATRLIDITETPLPIRTTPAHRPWWRVWD